MSALFVSHTYITNLEAGKKDNPSVAMLLKIIRLYGFTKDDITKIDVDPFILDNISIMSVIVRPSENAPASFTQSDLIRKISQELEKEDCFFDGSPEGTLKSKTSISIKCKDSKIGYLF